MRSVSDMSPPVQTLLALAVVAVAATWLLLRAFAKKKNPGCGSDCGAVSPEMKKLQARLKS
jgi:FeoB-associated Cys-rich membrane protein